MASSCPAVAGARASADAEQVHDEDEGLAGLDVAAGPALAVAEVRRDGEPPTATDLHPRDALVPAADDLPGAEPERERLAAVPGGVELATGRPAVSDVLHRALRPGHGLRAVAN